ncbi:glucosamine-fructose-6-phosphate aminotransferase, isomerising [Kipferlia bialata]|uniref:glutamine--fructose-6-phosphate transaminase (isomerizing) n=1 Tax=Kipferlia bialata TaxID=797122 RepID=A0A9K3CW79_9EUKA|nr:glucosamine-fructose-6-phosphate aminotransferase, isomerising [Kipferlia bialata]|eukprot:g4898.t1
MDTHVIRAKGNVQQLRDLVGTMLENGSLQSGAQAAPIALAHTRWATHGKSTPSNCHPVSDQSHSFAVVHNGMIANFDDIRAALSVSQDDLWLTETDTECIAKLAHRAMHYLSQSKGGAEGEAESVTLPMIAGAILPILKGSYAAGIRSSSRPNELLLARQGSPLVIGGSGLPPTVTVEHLPAYPGVTLETLSQASPTEHLAGTPHSTLLYSSSPSQDSPSSEATDSSPSVLALNEMDIDTAIHSVVAWSQLAQVMKVQAEREAAEQTIYASSDMKALPPSVEWIMLLQEGDVVHIDRSGSQSIRVYSHLEAQVGTVRTTIPSSELVTEGVSQGLGTFPHYMLKEIHEQPGVVERLIETYTSIPMSPSVHDWETQAGREGMRVQVEMGIPLQALLDCSAVTMLACGTSLHAAKAVQPLIESALQVPVTCVGASDFIDRAPPLTANTAIITVSQSGETADTRQALALAKTTGKVCFTLTVVNETYSALVRESDAHIPILGGQEVAVASTKAFTGQVVAMTLLSLSLAQRGNPSRAFLRHSGDILSSLLDLPEQIRQVLQQCSTHRVTRDGEVEREDVESDQLSVLAPYVARIVDAPGMLLLGRGYDSATVLEGALKVKEISYMHTH